MGMISSGILGDLNNRFCVFLTFFYIIFGILFLAAGLYDPGRDESITVETKPLVFSTLDENGKIIKKEFFATPPLVCKEICRTDDKTDYYTDSQ